MKKILCVTYRSWATNIYNSLSEALPDYDFKIINTKEDFELSMVYDFNPDLILWYGWSWIVPDEIIDKYISLCLHPSPLPKYRGGSPIQNQIINGEKISAVTVFKMGKGLDDGDIISQLPFSLEGDIKDIFKRMSDLGFSATFDIITKGYLLKRQDHTKATAFKRRKLKDSEITIDEIQTKSAEYLHNKIRMLTDPYPNAYIKCNDGKKLYITKSPYHD
jgi:methionyl-tRNA formyltransferase